MIRSGGNARACGTASGGQGHYVYMMPRRAHLACAMCIRCRGLCIYMCVVYLLRRRVLLAWARCRGCLLGRGVRHNGPPAGERCSARIAARPPRCMEVEWHTSTKVWSAGRWRRCVIVRRHGPSSVAGLPPSAQRKRTAVACDRKDVCAGRLVGAGGRATVRAVAPGLGSWGAAIARARDEGCKRHGMLVCLRGCI